MLVVDVQNEWQVEQFQFQDGAVELGRMPVDETAQHCLISDPHVSKQQLRVDLVGTQILQVRNLSHSTVAQLADGSYIEMGGVRNVELPAQLAIGRTQIWVRYEAPKPKPTDTSQDVGQPKKGDPERDRLMTINVPTRGKSSMVLSTLGDQPSPEQLARWFETVIQVQRAAAGSAEFYQQSAQAVCDLIGLDVGMVLLKKEDRWEIVGHASTKRGEDMSFSRTTLKYMTEERRTFYHGFGDDKNVASASLQDAKAVVASPVFDEETDEVAGAVYGSASLFGFGRASDIRPLEAQIVQVLAAVVGVGMARMQREQEAARRLVQLEQFSSPVVARELERDPTLLEGKDREVTMMFADIRNFSGLSEQLGPRQTCLLVRDIMDNLTDQVMAHDGVVVDYYGDGMCAMWNAPLEQPNHAAKACQAALNMISLLPELSSRWHEVVGRPLGLGVGLNTGPALVGNTGSMKKLKYGAMGKAVNLASRVEGATKHVGVGVLITASTKAQIGDEFNTRRIGKVRVVGLHEPVELYELAASPTDEWLSVRDRYEQALEHFEAGRFDECAAALEELASDGDLPCTKLAGRIDACRDIDPEKFDAVLTLDSK